MIEFMNTIAHAFFSDAVAVPITIAVIFLAFFEIGKMIRAAFRKHNEISDIEERLNHE